MIDENYKSYFGSLKNMDIEKVSKEQIAKYIYEKSLAKTNIYRGVISISEEDARLRGYDNREKWEQLMENKIYDIAEILNIKYSNAEWIASVHYEKGHPHLHYQLWDKNQGVNSYFITTAKQNKIRELLVKYVAQEELQGYYKVRDDIKQRLRDEARILEIKAFDKRYCQKKIPYINVKQVNKLSVKYNELLKQVPKTGSMKYGYMPEQVKSKIDEYIKLVIEGNCDLKNEVESYITNAENIGALYGNKRKKQIKVKAEKEIFNILGNQLLRAVKDSLQKEEDSKMVIRGYINTVVGILSLINDSNSSRYKLYKDYRQDMSLVAKREYAKMKAHASAIEWEK